MSDEIDEKNKSTSSKSTTISGASGSSVTAGPKFFYRPPESYER